jgi:hypothetical protein
MKAYCVDLRQKIIDAYNQQEGWGGNWLNGFE